MEYCTTFIGRKSGAPAKRVLRRWRGEIGTILAVRRARMARRIMPRSPAKERFLDGTEDEVTEVKGFNTYVEKRATRRGTTEPESRSEQGG